MLYHCVNLLTMCRRLVAEGNRIGEVSVSRDDMRTIIDAMETARHHSHQFEQVKFVYLIV